MTIRELRGHAASWKKRLGLREWEIQVHWGSPSKAPDPSQLEMSEDCDGNAWWFTEESHALILINKRSQIPLETLIHELLHVRLEGHKPAPGKYDPLYERALNTIAKELATSY